ncbi:MAG: carboxypeptidase-like regulatory domain-containing protein [Tannerellaceae bacterium]|nr:carboxypeptidase-like regulatory domain-containing protein [Tannerellaceae bacterium]
MKTVFISFLLFSSPYAISETLNKITLTGSNTTLKAAFEEIEKQTNLSVDYEESKIDIHRKINISITDMTINEALNLILKNSGYTHTIKGKHIIVSLQQPQQVDSRISISGIVTDTNGEPVIGANVVEKGTTNGSITDLDGKFTMEVQPGAVLAVSYIGYSPLNVAVGNRRTLTIRLSENTQALEEIVVVGYGVQRKSDVTGSISVATADDILRNSSFNALDRITGKSSRGEYSLINGKSFGNEWKCAAHYYPRH